MSPLGEHCIDITAWRRELIEYRRDVGHLQTECANSFERALRWMLASALVAIAAAPAILHRAGVSGAGASGWYSTGANLVSISARSWGRSKPSRRSTVPLRQFNSIESESSLSGVMAN